MVYVTKQARQELKRLISNGTGKPGTHLRLMDRGEGELGLDIDIMRPDDQSLEDDGQVLLIFNPELLSSLKNISLDAYEMSDGPRLVICEEVINQTSVTVTVNWISLTQSFYSHN